jgi:predicted metal-binding protein
MMEIAGMAKKIAEKVSEEQLRADLEKYRQLAFGMGAKDAKVITTDMVKIDERVRAKCLYPKCRHYGTNANCPPYSLKPRQTQRIVRSYKYALLIKIEIAPELIAGEKAREERLYVPSAAKLREMVSRIEAEAFYDGYYLALGFANGSCKEVFCHNQDCQALLPGKACRQVLRATSSLEAVGIDAMATAVKAGWEVYAIGRSTLPAEIPFGVRLGMVLIH